MNNTYALLDSGEGEKLEKIGSFVVRRPDPEALWHKDLSEDAGKKWQQADLTFSRIDSKTGAWKTKAGVKISDDWRIAHGGLYFIVKPTSFKHIGIFPEQIANWEWMTAVIGTHTTRAEKVSVLNLFGYTGGATLAAAKAGAEVTHVDASKPVVDWARENADLNGLSGAPIRWLVDDALSFVKREVKRGKKYDGIVMDPPAFGRGPDGEVWKIEVQFLELFDACTQLLADKPAFFIISGYASGYSATAFGNCLKKIEAMYGGSIETLELILKENSVRNVSLPAGVTARWKADR